MASVEQIRQRLINANALPHPTGHTNTDMSNGSIIVPTIGQRQRSALLSDAIKVNPLSSSAYTESMQAPQNVACSKYDNGGVAFDASAAANESFQPKCAHAIRSPSMPHSVSGDSVISIQIQMPLEVLEMTRK
ncbi:unnamed protein product [Phytomonas sp. Hart1]|nr:unnamed protein product [Phytomonas sp. Hart1]|eukprot:CCW69058.1 unnamed protein product [Phytomonas sp. isolate Hart1]